MRFNAIVLFLLIIIGNSSAQNLQSKVENLDVSKNEYSCVILRGKLRAAKTVIEKVEACDALADHYSNETEVAYNVDSIFFYRRKGIAFLESSDYKNDKVLAYELLKARRMLMSLENEESPNSAETQIIIKYVAKRDAIANNDLKHLASVYNSLGNLLMGRDSALVYYKMALELAERIDYHIIIAFASENITYEVELKSERQYYFNKAIDAYIELNDYSSLAYLLSNIGASYLDEQEEDSASIFFDLSLDYYQKLGFKWQEALHYYNQGWSLNKAGNLDESIVILNKAMDLAIHLGDDNIRANINNELAISYKNLANYSAALMHYFKALPLFKKLGNDRMYAGVLHNIGGIYGIISQHKLAVKHFEMALAENARLGNYEWQNFNYRRIAYEYIKQGQYTIALEKAQEASKVSRKNELNLFISDTILIGRCYEGLKNYQLAYTSFKSAEKMVNDKQAMGIVSHSIQMKSTLVNHRLGAFFYELFSSQYSGGIVGLNNETVNPKNYLMLAKKYIEVALTSDKNEEGIFNLKADRLELYSKILFATENYADAYIMQNKAQALKDSIFNDEKSREIASVEYKYKAFTDSIAEVKKAVDAANELEDIRERKVRKNRIQYSFVVIIVLLLAGTITATTRLSVSANLASGLIFIFFILLFEFLLVVLDPWVDSISSGEVGYKIAINTVIALVLFGIHHVSEKRLKTILIKVEELD